MARRDDIDATILGVGSRDSEQAIADFVQRHGLDPQRMLADVDGTVWEANGVSVQPAWVFVDGETGAATTKFGELSNEQLLQELAALAS